MILPSQSVPDAYKMSISVSSAKSRTSKDWIVKKVKVEERVKSFNKPFYLNLTRAEIVNLSKDDQLALKDKNPYFLGVLKSGRRNRDSVLSRSAITLDADSPGKDFLDLAKEKLNRIAYTIHPTFSYTPAKPRYRLVIYLDREVSSNEYELIARYIAEQIGLDHFDATTFQPNRMMFSPVWPKEEDYFIIENKGPAVAVDNLLNSCLFSQEQVKFHTVGLQKKKNRKDPRERSDLPGIYNRLNPISELLAGPLAEVYLPTDFSDRYTYSKGSSYAGAITYDDLFLYSHHDTDPASQILCDAFDITQIHLKGHLDSSCSKDTPLHLRPSYKAMIEDLERDKNFMRFYDEEKLIEARKDFRPVINQDEDSLRDESKNRLLQHLLKKEEHIRERAKSSITHTTPLLYFEDIELVKKNTIVITQGKFGSHKSRHTESIISLILSKDSNESYIGLRKGECSLSAIYIDTERNIAEEFPLAIQRVCKNAGYSPYETPGNFYYTSIKDLPRNERLTAVKEYITYIRERTTDHLCVFLDVLTDCVRSFNDEAESLAFLDFLGNLADKYNCTIFGVIHENPSSTEAKARGHIGTEAANKASTVFSIGYDKSTEGKETELIKLQFLKVRSAKRPLPLYLVFDPETGNLQKADILEENAFLTEGPLQDLAGRLSVILSKPRNFTELMSESGLSKNTLKKRLDNLISLQTPITNQTGDICFLSVSKGEKNSSIYCLKPDLLQ